ncbi:MAG: M20/M25/M40 family metallo-hydrolase [Planctomycetota bacterium]
MTVPTPESVAVLLQEMVRINSINRTLPGSDGGEALLVDYLAKIAGAWGLDCYRLPVAEQTDQLLIILEVDKKKPWIMFDSHLDTVAVEGMTIEPFSGELRDGRVWGRGACDTKGTGAAMLWAMYQCYTENSQASQPNNLALLFGVDEEVAMEGVASFINNDLPDLGWRPSAVIVGEPTELRPVIAHHGCLRLSLTTRGKACHSSTPHDGVSAISAMVKIIDAIENEYIPSLKAEHPLAGPAVCSINTIRGGSAPNIVPDHCTIEIDRRLAPGEESAKVITEFLQQIARLGDLRDPIRVEHTVQVDHPPLTTRNNGSLVEYIKKILDQQNLATLTLGAPFATHASYYDAAGISSIVLGPGSPHPAHTKDEWVDVDQIEKGVDLYRSIMETTLPACNS